MAYGGPQYDERHGGEPARASGQQGGRPAQTAGRERGDPARTTRRQGGDPARTDTRSGPNGQAGLTALGDPTRREIFERIAERPRSVGELADGLPVSRPAVSQHLKVLKEAGLVTDAAVGNRRVY